ncbi:MAG: hypothetical protein ABSH19_02915 [Opitutales bacterium]|jgi:ElaB/YqjD/DUF883 family membrane-anchored ribosome-binding protein
MKNNKDTVHPTVEPISHLHASLDAAKERFTDIYEDTNKKIAAGAKRTDSTIRKYPYLTLLIAFKVGLIAGVLVARRRK